MPWCGFQCSGFNVLSSIAKDRTSLTSGEILEHVMVVSAAAVQIELESSRPMDGWQEVTVEYAVLSTCPPGYTFEVQGTRQGCSPCPAGLFSNASGGECVPCAEGTANHLTGQSQCTLCQEGYYQPFSGQMRCEMCLGTVRAHATACEMPEGFPLYGYILLAILGIGAGILMILAAKFALSRKPRAMDHQIKFEDLEFDVPPHVLGSGSLGLVVAATYRGFPVAVKQIKKGYAA